MYGMLCLLTLNNFGVDITALIAGLGIGGIAVALAVQNILGDLFASLTIVLDKPFIVGDLIVVGESTGYVERIGLKTTHIRYISGELLIFPNGDLLKSQIRNFRRMYERRIVFLTQVVYQTPYDALKIIPKIIQKSIESQNKTRFERSHLKNFGLFSIEFETVYWVEDREMSVYMKIQEQINLEIFRQFTLERIEFAHFVGNPVSHMAPMIPASVFPAQAKHSTH
jgi:small-conductance mechanosensitive channel